MDKRKKYKRTNNDLQNTTQKTKDRATRTPLKPKVIQNGKQFLLHMWYPSCYSCYKLGDKSLMRKEPDCDYDKRNISAVKRYEHKTVQKSQNHKTKCHKT